MFKIVFHICFPSIQLKKKVTRTDDLRKVIAF